MRLPEHRRVLVGVGVGLAADRRDDRGVLLGLDVLRALEHHVLEEMREAGAARLLVLRADVIPELDVHDRRRLVLVQDDDQAVGQHQALVLRASAAAPRPAAAPARRRPPRRPASRNRIENFFIVRHSFFVIRYFFELLSRSSSALQLPAHLRQLAEHRRRPPPLIVLDRRIARDERVSVHRRDDRRPRRRLDAIADRQVAGRRRPGRRTSRCRRSRCCRRCRPAPPAATFLPSTTPCAICTRLSIFVPALMRVSPTAGRSIVVLAPISTSSSITTGAGLRNLLVRAVGRCAKP